MECASCGHENRAGAKFCDECGAPLRRLCSSCGNELRPLARFCDDCGTPAGGPVKAARAPLSNSSAVEAVRKTVTVLFCDVVGSTAFAEQVDAEAAREAMGQYHSMARTVIETNDGTVSKFIGDGVMAIWGVPEVAEDDALRAVICGVALQQGFDAIEGHIADHYGAEVGLRVGINTGEVVIADQDADIVGDPLNTAARLEAACTPGQVLVGEETWRLTRSSVKYEMLGEVTIKGKQEPVAAFQVLEQAVENDELATPFVGRDTEMASLRDALDAAVEEKTVQLVTVIGSPGVGKTRLVAELAASLGDTAVSFDVRCERSSSSAFAPIRDLLLGLARVGSDSEPEEMLASLGSLFTPEVDDKDRLVELLGSFVGVTEPQSAEESFFAIRRTLEVLGSYRPVVLVVDDLQWAGALLLDLLEHLAEWVSGGAVLIVGLARPEIRSIRASLTEPGHRVATVVSLEGLDAAATEELAAQLLGGAELPRDLVAQLPESTEGNPLFVREFVRMLADDGVIVRNGDSYELTIEADAVEVPPTIQSLLATRVERLPDDERRVVELASVVGSEFPRGALAAVAADYSTAEVDSVLERLRRKELVDPTGSYWGDEPVLRFHHVLIRDAAYRRLLKGTRAELHLAIGRWTEETAGNVIGEHEASIAFLYEQAHQYRGELGPLDDETRAHGNHAARLLHAAAARALESEDLAAAGSLAGRALGCLDDGDRIRPTILLLACEALASSDIPAARSAVAELAAVATDKRLAAWATCFESQLTVVTDPTGLVAAAAACETAALTLAELGDVAGVAKAHQIRAGALARLGRVGDCEAELDLALTAARAADDRRRITAVLGAAPLAALWGPSAVPRAGGRCLDVIRLLRIAVSSPAVEATSTRCQAVLEALRGRFDTARTMLDTSRRTAQELGLRQGLMETELYSGIVEVLANEPAAAEAHLRTAHAGLDRLGIGADAGHAAAYLARSLLLQDKLDDAEQLAVEADEHAGENLQTAIAAKSARAEILAARGHHDEAVTLGRQAVAIAVGTDILVDHASAVAALARILHAAGRDEDATAAGFEAERLWQAKGASVDGDRFVAESRQAREAVGPGPTAVSQPNNERLEPSEVERAALAARSPQGQRLLALQESGSFDLDRYVTMLAPDLVRSDRRDASGTSMGVGGRDDFVAGLDALRAVGGNYARLTPLAADRNRLLLVKGVADYGNGRHTPFIVILRWNDDDLLDLISAYRDDDQEGAEAEFAKLASLSAATEPDDSPGPSEPGSGQPLTNRATEIAGQFLETPSPMELDVLMAGLATSFSRDDQRSGISFPIANRAEYIESVRPFYSMGGTINMGEILAVRGQHLALVRSQMNYGDGNVSPILVLARVTPHDELDRIIVFDPDDRHRATLELDRLYGDELAVTESAESPGTNVVNAASRIWVSRFDQAVNANDWATAGCMLSDTLQFDVHRRTVSGVGGGKAEFQTQASSWIDFGMTTENTPMAVRGDRLILLETRQRGNEDFDVRIFNVVEVNDSGEATYLGVWDEGDLRLANDELNRRWLGTLDDSQRAAATFTIEIVNAIVHADLDWIDVHLAPGFESNDHRPAGLGNRDRATFIAMVAQRPTTVGDGVMIIREFLRCDADWVIASVEGRTLPPNGGGYVSEQQITACRLNGDQLLRADIYPVELPDQALAAADEVLDKGEPKRHDPQWTRDPGGH